MSARISKITTMTKPTFIASSPFETPRYCVSEILPFDTLPFAFGHQRIERMNHKFDRFKIFSVRARDFRMSMVIAQRAAKFENRSLRTSQLFDAAIDFAFVR